MTEEITDTEERAAGEQLPRTLWQKLKLAGAIALCVVLAALGAIGIAIGLAQTPG